MSRFTLPAGIAGFYSEAAWGARSWTDGQSRGRQTRCPADPPRPGNLFGVKHGDFPTSQIDTLCRVPFRAIHQSFVNRLQPFQLLVIEMFQIEHKIPRALGGPD